MDAVISSELESKQSDLTTAGQGEKPERSGQVEIWTAILSLITSPFSLQRTASGLIAQATKRWGISAGAINTAIGILAGLLALYGSYLALPQGPAMTVSAGKDLTVSYHPQNELIKLLFNVQAEEFGSKPNQILAAKAWIEQPLTPRRPLQIGAPQFEENSLRTYEPWIPNGPTPRNMQCSFCFRLDGNSREAFQSVGFRRLIVEFKDKSGDDHRVTFCFNIDKDHLLTSEEKEFQYISEDVMCPEYSF